MRNNFKYILIALMTFWSVQSHAQIDTITNPYDSRNLENLRFTLDYLGGKNDLKGQYMGGTETMAFEAHKGMLFAAIGYWKWRVLPGEQPSGAQVLVKKSAAGQWMADASFASKYGRTSCLHSVTFTTDYRGIALNPPVTILCAGMALAGANNKSVVMVREDLPDGSGIWHEDVINSELDRYTTGSAFSETRTLMDHVDKQSGIHYLFAICSAGSSQDGSFVVRGAYDPSIPSKIKWDQVVDGAGPNDTGFARRCLSAVDADGMLYVSINVNPLKSGEGGLHLRDDFESDPTRRYRQIYEWVPGGASTDSRRTGMRGLTAIPDPSGGALNVLLGARELPGTIDRIDPNRNYAIVQDLDVQAMLNKLWYPSNPTPVTIPMIIHYDNNMVRFADPSTGEKVVLAGLGAEHPERCLAAGYYGPRSAEGDASWYLVRHQNGDYGLGMIHDPANPHPLPDRGLRSCRAIGISPFPEDAGRVLYFGGFDAGVGPDSSSHRNTAWIMRGEYPIPSTVVITYMALPNPIIYPNPAQEKLFISNLPPDFSGSISIFNSLGQLILSEQNTGSIFDLNIENLNEGIYFIQIKSVNGTVYSDKFIKY